VLKVSVALRKNKRTQRARSYSGRLTATVLSWALLKQQPLKTRTHHLAETKKTEKQDVRNAQFKARMLALLGVKRALLRQARRVGSSRGPNWPDGTLDAAFYYTDESSALIKKRGGFPKEIVYHALSSPEWETKELIAAWLRNELELLRAYSSKPGAAPVRTGKALSKLQIAEIAIELLEPLGGNQLTSLFQELLDIDRHRKSLANNYEQMNKAAQADAASQLQGSHLGVNHLARELGVAGSPVTRWRQSQRYLEMVKSHKETWDRVLREHYFKQIKSLYPQATEPECFRRALQMYAETLPQRQATFGSNTRGA
jgi:hypothetical protein